LRFAGGTKFRKRRKIVTETVIIRGNEVPKKHYSYSQASKAVICPLKHWWHYREGVREPSNVNLVIGRAIHATTEFDFTAKIVTGKNEPLDVKQDFLIGMLKQELALPDLVLQPGEDLDGLSKIALKLLAVHHVERALSVNPIAVEKMHIVNIPGVDTPILLYIDLIEETDKGYQRIADLKTSRNRYLATSAATSMQLALASHATGIEDVQFDVLVKGNGTYQAVPGKMTQPVRDYNLMRLARILQNLEAGIYIPPEPGEWPCNPSCFYWTRCAGLHIPTSIFEAAEKEKADRAEAKSAEKAAKASVPKKTVRKKAPAATEASPENPVD